MSGSPIQTLEELLGALASERGLRGRLRVLGRSWTLLRSLPPVQREQVALRLGSKWVWKRIEQTFLKDGQLDENEQLVGQVFERLGDSDPAELRKLARMIKEGDRRGAKDLLMTTLAEALEEEATEEEKGVDPIEPPHSAPAPPEPKRENRGKLVETPAEVLVSARARPVDARPIRQDVSPPARHEPAARPQAVPSTVRESPPPPKNPGDPVLPFSMPTTGGGAERLRILRALQQTSRPGADLGREGRAELIDALGGGWASRRALSRMISTHSVEDLGEALELIRALARPGQQFWCLADLLEEWDLDPAEIERVLERAPSDASRRRLSRRAPAA